MARLSKEDVVTIEALRKRGQSAPAVARVLGVTEGTVRYHDRRAAAGAADGRSRQVHVAAAFVREARSRTTETTSGGRSLQGCGRAQRSLVAPRASCSLYSFFLLPGTRSAAATSLYFA